MHYLRTHTYICSLSHTHTHAHTHTHTHTHTRTRTHAEYGSPGGCADAAALGCSNIIFREARRKPTQLSLAKLGFRYLCCVYLDIAQ